MANTLAPSGFNQAGSTFGALPNFAMRTMLISSTLTSQIGFGDPVRQLASGYIDKYAAGGTTITGVFAGCKYFNSAVGRTQFYPAWTAPSVTASTIVQALVISDPSAVFQVQGEGAALTQTHIGNNIDIKVAGSGTPTLAGISQCSVVTSSAATTGTLPFKIVNIVGLTSGVSTPAINPAYDPTSTNNWVEVSFNTNALLQTTGI